MAKWYRVISVVILGIFTGCAATPSHRLNGTLEIRFDLEKPDAAPPSYQTTIWLENDKGQLVKTLFVSDYLSYGGFVHPTICPTWAEQADWENAPMKTVDAVTGATPSLGSNTLTFDCSTLGLEPGPYTYAIETHLVQKYNILYRGTIHIGGEADRSAATATYIPEKMPDADGVLKNVSARYLKGN